MKSHESRPTSFTPFPEANIKATLVVVVEDVNVNENEVVISRTHQKWDHRDGKNDKNTTGKVESLCYRYGAKNHWSHTCRTPKHLVELYQQSLKDK
ncbi:hypothetical protein EPI10_005700 [Gossypium australe]|uniref:Uncharacterized protein n=1 Tax=Gossypium australe TaxID=47621 RepID=A0A5B6WQC7_9ROSI|nr:hypothetical protein EPI10_005700 [Gossypium australe]